MRTLLAILLSGVGAVAQEPVDTGKLPMSAERKVDFATDIQPLLKRSCLKCHGEKRPKSDFRMTSRESALKGGELGVAILPGDSANSPLVHFIAGLVEDTRDAAGRQGTGLEPRGDWLGSRLDRPGRGVGATD